MAPPPSQHGRPPAQSVAEVMVSGRRMRVVFEPHTDTLPDRVTLQGPDGEPLMSFQYDDQGLDPTVVFVAANAVVTNY